MRAQFTTKAGPALIDPAQITALETIGDGSTAVYFGPHRIEVSESLAAVQATIDAPAPSAKPAKPAKK